MMARARFGTVLFCVVFVGLASFLLFSHQQGYPAQQDLIQDSFERNTADERDLETSRLLKHPKRRRQRQRARPTTFPIFPPLTTAPSHSPYHTALPSQTPVHIFSGGDKTVPPTNILILLADDLGYNDVGFHAATGPGLTPNLTLIARSPHSILFENFHTFTVCSPSRAAILSGRYPEIECTPGANRQNRFPARLGMTTIGQDAKNYGYTTSYFGKWHLGSFSVRTPAEFGFDFWFASEDNLVTYDAPCHCLKPECLQSNCSRYPLECSYDRRKGKCKNKEPCFMGFLPRLDVFFDTYQCNMDSNFEEAPGNSSNSSSRLRLNSGYKDAHIPRLNMSAQILAVNFEKYIRQVPSAQPFLSIMAFHEPHMPYISDPKVRERCEASDHYCAFPPGLGTNSKLANYLGAVGSLDDAVGQVFRVLQQIGRYNNTMVLFLSDNGPEEHARGGAGSAWPFRGMKRSLYEGGHRVPAFVHWPAEIQTNRRLNSLVSVLDLRPTFQEIMAPTAPELQFLKEYDGDGVIGNLDGQSFLPLIRSLTDDWVRPNGLGICEWARADIPQTIVCNSYAYYEGNWKVIAPLKKPLSASSAFLVDIVKDPYEARNLALDNSTFTKEILGRALTWVGRVKSTFKMNCPHLARGG